jgi:hypothetical protein
MDPDVVAKLIGGSFIAIWAGFFAFVLYELLTAPKDPPWAI